MLLSLFRGLVRVGRRRRLLRDSALALVLVGNVEVVIIIERLVCRVVGAHQRLCGYDHGLVGGGNLFGRGIYRLCLDIFRFDGLVLRGIHEVRHVYRLRRIRRRLCLGSRLVFARVRAFICSGSRSGCLLGVVRRLRIPGALCRIGGTALLFVRVDQLHLRGLARHVDLVGICLLRAGCLRLGCRRRRSDHIGCLLGYRRGGGLFRGGGHLSSGNDSLVCLGCRDELGHLLLGLRRRVVFFNLVCRGHVGEAGTHALALCRLVHEGILAFCREVLGRLLLAGRVPRRQVRLLLGSGRRRRLPCALARLGACRTLCKRRCGGLRGHLARLSGCLGCSLRIGLRRAARHSVRHSARSAIGLRSTGHHNGLPGVGAGKRGIGTCRLRALRVLERCPFRHDACGIRLLRRVHRHGLHRGSRTEGIAVRRSRAGLPSICRSRTVCIGALACLLLFRLAARTLRRVEQATRGRQHDGQAGRVVVGARCKGHETVRDDVDRIQKHEQAADDADDPQHRIHHRRPRQRQHAQQRNQHERGHGPVDNLLQQRHVLDDARRRGQLGARRVDVRNQDDAAAAFLARGALGQVARDDVLRDTVCAHAPEQGVPAVLAVVKEPADRREDEAEHEQRRAHRGEDGGKPRDDDADDGDDESDRVGPLRARGRGELVDVHVEPEVDELLRDVLRSLVLLFRADGARADAVDEHLHVFHSCSHAEHTSR